jgi:hypothetical protein
MAAFAAELGVRRTRSEWAAHPMTLPVRHFVRDAIVASVAATALSAAMLTHPLVGECGTKLSVALALVALALSARLASGGTGWALFYTIAVAVSVAAYLIPLGVGLLALSPSRFTRSRIALWGWTLCYASLISWLWPATLCVIHS